MSNKGECLRKSRPDTVRLRYPAKYFLLPDVISMRNFLFGITAVVFCLSFTPASAQQAITTPILASDANFRDLAGISASNGGTGFVNTTSNNGVMRTGVFYRSQALSILSSADKGTLSTLHIGLDIDLRTPKEISDTPSLFAPNAGPDWVPSGAAYINVNIYGTPDTPSSGLVNSPETAVAYMKSSYQGFVTDPAQRAAFHTVLIALAHEPGAALFHCSGGKDRTGWTAMLLQNIAGVSPTTIMNDYLATNSYMAATINEFLALVPTDKRAMFAVMLGVQSEFLQAGLDQVTVSYGSLDAYLTQGLGLSQEDISALRNKMVSYNFPWTMFVPAFIPRFHDK
jgi:protein-tyrosine phosphatase